MVLLQWLFDFGKTCCVLDGEQYLFDSRFTGQSVSPSHIIYIQLCETETDRQTDRQTDKD